MRRLILAALLVSTAAVPVSSAHAAFFPSEVIDGPTPDLVEVGDIDLSRDGNGAMVYVKKADGVNHVFVSRFTDGAFAPPERLDGNLGGASSQPVVGTSDAGRVAIAFVNDGTLYTSLKAKDAPGFTAPTAVASGGVSNPSIDMSINGATYVSFTQSGDVKVARANRDDPAYTLLPASMDIDAAREAGTGDRLRSRVDVSADGTGLVVWGERGSDGRTHVHARRLFELRLSAFPQDLTLNEVDGQPATGADTPELDMEDDSSYAQVVFRQNTAAGPRVVMRRLVGSTFDPPQALDNGTPGTSGTVDLTGRGEGLYGVTVGNDVLAGTLFDNRIKPRGGFTSGNGVAPQPVPAVGQNEDGALAYFTGSGAADAAVRARYLDGVEFPKVEPEALLSRPELGPADTGAGLDASASRAGDVAVVFVQGTGADKRLVAGVYDKPPSRIAGSNSQKIRKLTRLRWGTSLNLFGGVRYRVIVDEKVLGEVTGQELVPTPGQVPDGEHRWRVVAVDRRGQETPSRTRLLRVDNTPPTVRASFKKMRRTLTVSVRAGDPEGALPSGLSRVLVDFGDGQFVPVTTRARKTYARTGSYSVRVKALDRAGNETVTSRRISIG